MASIGLRVDHGTAGTELASILAKAINGDPMDRYKAANYLSEIGYKDALTKAAVEEANRKQGAYSTQFIAGNVLGDAAFDKANQPVVVEPSAAAPAAATPAAAAPPPFVPGPTPSFPQPAPVESVVASRQPMPRMFGSDTPLPPPPAAGRGPEPDYQMPGSYAFDIMNHTGSAPPVSVEPDFRTSTWGATPTQPEQGAGSWLTDMIGLNKTMGVDREDPYGNGLIDPNAGRQVVVPGRTPEPVPVDLGAIPSSTIPGRVGPVAPASGAPPPMPVPVEPPYAGVEPQAAAPVAVAPEQGPPMPTPEQKQALAIAATQPPAPVQPGEKVDHGDGTVSVGTTAGGVRLTREQYQILGRAGMLGGGDAAGQTQKLLGTAGMLEDPNFGKDQATTFRDLTLAAGGSTPGRDSVYGTDEAIRKDIAVAKGTPEKPKDRIQVIKDVPYTVNIGPDGQPQLSLTGGFEKPPPGSVFDGPGDKETKATMVLGSIQTKMQQGQELTSEDVQNVGLANQILRPMQHVNFTDADGYTHERWFQTPPPEGMLTPEKVLAYKPGQPGAPAAAPAAAAPAAAAPAAAAPAAAAPAAAAPAAAAPAAAAPAVAAAAPAAVGTVVPTAGGGADIRTSDTVAATEAGNKAYNQLSQAANSFNYFRTLDPSRIPKIIQLAMQDPKNPAYQQALIMADPDAREFMGHVAALQDVMVHTTTGASSTPGEQANAILQAVPRPGDSEKNMQAKRSQALNMLRGMRSTLTGHMDPRALKTLDDAYRAGGYDLAKGELVDQPGGGGNAPATKGPSDDEVMKMPAPDGWKPDLWGAATAEEKRKVLGL